MSAQLHADHWALFRQPPKFSLARGASQPAGQRVGQAKFTVLQWQADEPDAYAWERRLASHR